MSTSTLLIAWDLSNGVNIKAKWVTKTLIYTKTNNVKLVAKKSQRGRLQQMFPLRLQLRCYYRSLRKLYFWLCQSWILRTSFSSLTLAGTSTISWIRYKNIIQVSINITTYRQIGMNLHFLKGGRVVERENVTLQFSSYKARTEDRWEFVGIETIPIHCQAQALLSHNKKTS